MHSQNDASALDAAPEPFTVVGAIRTFLRLLVGGPRRPRRDERGARTEDARRRRRTNKYKAGRRC